MIVTSRRKIRRFWLRLQLFEDGQNVVSIEDFELLAVEFDFGAAILADEHAITFLYFKGNFLPIIVNLAGAEGHDETFHWFFFGGVRDNDSALFYFLLFDRFHEDSIAEGFNV